MRHFFDFELRTTTEAILYTVQNVSRPTLHTVFKVLYFADKYHLQKYGFLVTGDRYVAMEQGPVPSRAYDLAKIARSDHEVSGEGVEYFLDAVTVTGNHRFGVKRDPRLDYLSDSEIEALDYAIEECNGLDFGTLKEKSHDESWKATARNKKIDFDNFTLGFDNRDDLLEHLKDPIP